MSSTQDLIAAMKSELKKSRITYADLARSLGMAESSVKRMFAKGDMPLKRIDEICSAMRLDFAELARQVADQDLPAQQLTEAQELAVISDRKLLLVTTCVLSEWPFDQIVETYQITEAEAVGCMVQLDRLGILELRPLNRYRLKVAKTFRWRTHGPVMRFFREQGIDDFFSGGFDGEAELLSLVHGRMNPSAAALLRDRLQRVAHDFAQQHKADMKLPMERRRAFTLVIGMRTWLFRPLREMLRDPAQAPD
jgi:DNA-binding Xre family transcriptional regulator